MLPTTDRAGSDSAAVGQQLIRRSATFVLLLLLAGSASGMKPVPSVESSGWDAMTAADWDSLGDSTVRAADAAVLFERIDVDDRDGSREKYGLIIYARIRIQSAAGRKWGDVEVPYLSKGQKLQDVRARSIQRSGDTVALDPTQVVEKEVLKSEKLKVKMQSFSIPGVTDDCIVEYFLRLQASSEFTRWTVQREIPVCHGTLHWYLNLKASIGWLTMSPCWIALNVTNQVAVEKLPSVKDVKELRFDVANLPALKEEKYTLPKQTLAGQVLLYYSYSQSPDAYWGSLASTLPLIVDEFAGKDRQMAKVLKQFETTLPREEKMQAAYQWAQTSFRNISYRSKTDTSEAPDEPRTVGESIKKGIATSENICIMFCDLLRSLNIDARLAYVVSRNGDLLVRDAMYWQFNQTLVTVADSVGGWRYFAPGNLYMPFGQVPWFAEGVSALLGGAGSVVFSKVPISPSTQNTVSRTVTLTLGDDLTLSGHFTESSTGHCARELRMKYFDAGKGEWAGMVKARLADDFPSFDADSITIVNAASSTEPLQTSCTVVTPNPVGNMAGDRLLVRPIDLLEQGSNPFTSAERRNDVVFDYANEEAESLRIDYPTDWVVEAVAPDTTFSNPVGTCSVHLIQSANSITVHRVFKLNSPFVSLEYYKPLQELYAARAAQAASTVSFKRVVN